jgi:hypothetical protein
MASHTFTPRNTRCLERDARPDVDITSPPAPAELT